VLRDALFEVDDLFLEQRDECVQVPDLSLYLELMHDQSEKDECEKASHEAPRFHLQSPPGQPPTVRW